MHNPPAAAPSAGVAAAAAAVAFTVASAAAAPAPAGIAAASVDSVAATAAACVVAADDASGLPTLLARTFESTCLPALLARTFDSAALICSLKFDSRSSLLRRASSSTRASSVTPLSIWEAATAENEVHTGQEAALWAAAGGHTDPSKWNCAAC
eukprot:364003-Chlamydomonas_euryale.AAC.46